MEMRQFVKEYLHILYEHKGNTGITVKEYEEFLKTAVKFDENYNVISEDSNDLIDIPEEAIQFLLNNNHSKIGGDWLKYYLEKSRHWRNIKNIKINDVYFDMFDFSNSKEIDRFNFNCFGISEDELEKARQFFLNYVKNDFGFYNTYNRINVICINSNVNDVHQVMHHELSHFIQHIGNIRIVKGLNPDDLKNKNILETEFKTSYKQVISYFSSEEFIPHIDDMKVDLKKLRQEYYNELTGFQFKNCLYDFLDVRNRKELEESELFKNFWKMKNGEVSSLMMLLFSKISGYKFQKILDWLKEVFI